MTDELVNIVNEQDEVVGTEMKSICHKQGLKHKVSAIFLFNNDKDIWVQKRAQGKLGAGLLDYSASGHVPAGDSYVSSAYREMQEELGIDPRLEYLTKGLIENDDLETQEFIRIRHNLALFRGFYENRFELQKKEFKLQKEEVESIELYSLDKLKEIMGKNPEKLTEGFKVGINYLLEKNES